MKLDIQLSPRAAPIESDAEQRAWEQAFQTLAELMVAAPPERVAIETPAELQIERTEQPTAP